LSLCTLPFGIQVLAATENTGSFSHLHL